MSCHAQLFKTIQWSILYASYIHIYITFRSKRLSTTACNTPFQNNAPGHLGWSHSSKCFITVYLFILVYLIMPLTFFLSLISQFVYKTLACLRSPHSILLLSSSLLNTRLNERPPFKYIYNKIKSWFHASGMTSYNLVCNSRFLILFLNFTM